MREEGRRADRVCGMHAANVKQPNNDVFEPVKSLQVYNNTLASDGLARMLPARPFRAGSRARACRRAQETHSLAPYHCARAGGSLSRTVGMLGLTAPVENEKNSVRVRVSRTSAPRPAATPRGHQRQRPAVISLCRPVPAPRWPTPSRSCCTRGWPTSWPGLPAARRCNSRLSRSTRL